MLRLVIAALFSVAMSLMHAQDFFEDFSDGEFLTNPTWTGNTTEFLINGEEQLQLNDSEEGLSYISVEVNEQISSDVEWRFFIRQSFSPSANNNSRFYLMSSAESTSYTGTGVPDLEGYFLQFGESGSADAIELFRNDSDGSTTSVARGTDGFIAGSSELTIKVVRSSSGNWEIWADPNAGEEFVLQDSGIDNTYDQMNYLSWVCKYTSSNSSAFYLDNVYVGEPILDTEAPELLSVSYDSSTSLILTFNEPLNETSVNQTENYIFDDFSAPIQAELTSSTEVVLSFSEAFSSGVEYTFTVNGLEDIAGNPTVNLPGSFEYFETSPPEIGELIINEIFADPTPPVGLPDAEWLEILNTTSDKNFQLSEVEFYNTATLNTLPEYILSAGESVVITSSANAAALSTFGNTIATQNFTALSNGEDSLTLVYFGNVIEWVTYNDDWYDDPDKDDGGWSLERINPFSSCSGPENWTASNSAIGGTPGSENSVFSDAEDVTPPEIESVSLINTSLLFIEASEILNALVEDFIIELDNGISISSQSLSASGTGILLNLSDEVEIGVPFNISISNLIDCEGNVNTEVLEFEVLSGFPAELGDVIITEIMADPSPGVGLPEVEYIEIYNTTGDYIDCSDFLISESAEFVNRVILSPGEYLAILSEESIPGTFIFDSKGAMSGWSSAFLTNGGFEIRITNSNGEIDKVNYDISWYADNEKDDGGWSLERIDLTDPCSDKSNWAASESVFGGTPGEMNSIFSDAEDVAPPEVILSYAYSGGFILEFSEPIDEASYTTDFITINGESPFSVWMFTSENSMHIELLNGLDIGVTYMLELNGILDCWGNELSGFMIELAVGELAEEGDVIINEVLSNPADSGSDYVEIYNLSSKFISLQNWKIANRDEGELGTIRTLSDFPITLNPGGYLLLTEDEIGTAAQYPNAVTSNFWIMDIPSYNNDEGDVVLLNSADEVMDEFHYESDYHFGLLDDTDGVSLERISGTVETQNPDNWSSAASSENYGTPGYVNSQNQLVTGSSGGISVYPEVFAPESGALAENNLEISYAFESGSQSATIDIYNKDGIRVRELVSNELIGSSGTFFWDGLDDNSQKLPVGIYVIHMEVFNLSGIVESYKVTAVIGQI